MAASQRLNASVEALAALGAKLRLRSENMEGDPRVRRLLQEVVRSIDPKLLDGLNPEQEATALGFIQAFFRQAVDLLENPARAPGWVYADPLVLQAQGKASFLVVRAIEALAAQKPDLGETLKRPGAFLDVGTGVGWLAIEAARSWPAMKVVGIDPWEPALKIARANVAESGVADRIELRSQGVQQLQDCEAYSLVWLAGPFLPPEVVDVALERSRNALAPGGWLVFGLYTQPPDPLGQALTTLRVVRSGGHPWTANEIESRLGALEFEQIEVSALRPPVLMVVGKRPEK